MKPDMKLALLAGLAPMVAIHAVLILAVLMTGCGSSSGAGSASPEAVEPTDKEEVSTKSVVDEEGKSVTALAVDELPACNSANQKQLVYLTSDSKFYSCETNLWKVIQVTNTVNNVTEVTESNLLWEDELTGRSWFIKGLANSYSGCEPNTPAGVTKTFETPTLAQIQAAIANGLFEGVNVKIYHSGNNYIESSAPSVSKSDFSANLWAFNLCLISE